jgi:hypothetical protein
LLEIAEKAQTLEMRAQFEQLAKLYERIAQISLQHRARVTVITRSGGLTRGAAADAGGTEPDADS